MPDPILTAIATSLVTKAAGGLYDLVKAQFGKRGKKDVAALDTAVSAGPQADMSGLTDLLADATRDDGKFDALLRAEWARISIEQRIEHGGVNNQITGVVNGNVVQARDIQGGISFGS